MVVKDIRNLWSGNFTANCIFFKLVQLLQHSNNCASFVIFRRNLSKIISFVQNKKWILRKSIIHEWIIERMKSMNEWMTEWMSQWINQSINESIYEWLMDWQTDWMNKQKWLEANIIITEILLQSANLSSTLQYFAEISSGSYLW